MGKNKYLIYTFIFFILGGCSTSPTGRGQLQLVPESQMNSMGEQAFGQMKKEIPIEQNLAMNRYIQCIVIPIVKVLPKNLAAQKWEIVVFKQPETINAFALPGGKIGVYTGILKVAKTPGQLAAVLGHEVGHVIANHGNERVSEGLAAQGGLIAASLFTKNNPHQKLIMGLLGLGSQYGIILPHGRTQESEADIIGIDLMAQAGFDPHESVQLWKNMASASGSSPMEFLSTHPSHDTRIKDLEKQMNKAYHHFIKAKTNGGEPQCLL